MVDSLLVLGMVLETWIFFMPLGLSRVWKVEGGSTGTRGKSEVPKTLYNLRGVFAFVCIFYKPIQRIKLRY